MGGIGAQAGERSRRAWARGASGVALAALIGCGPPKDSGSTGAVDTGLGGGDELGADGGVSVTPPEWTVTLSAEGVEIDVVGGPGGYWFGVVDAADRSWTAEDCLGGQELSDGQVVDYCHDAGNSGRRRFLKVERAQDMTPATTLFDIAKDGMLTYVLFSDPAFGGSGECWIQGANPGYYSDAGCS